MIEYSHHFDQLQVSALIITLTEKKELLITIASSNSNTIILMKKLLKWQFDWYILSI